MKVHIDRENREVSLKHSSDSFITQNERLSGETPKPDLTSLTSETDHNPPPVDNSRTTETGLTLSEQIDNELF